MPRFPLLLACTTVACCVAACADTPTATSTLTPGDATLRAAQAAAARGTRVSRVTIAYVSGSVDTTTWKVVAGGTAQFRATAYDASNNVVSTTVRFTSTNGAALAVDSTTGLAKAVAAGSGAITVTAGTSTTGTATATSRTITVTAAATTTTTPSGSYTVPALPSATVDVSMPTPTGRTISVAAGGSLQAAIDAATPGDVIELAPGATFTGNFYLPAKPGSTASTSNWIVIRPGPGVTLPAAGTRLNGPAYAGQLPKIVSANAMAPVTVNSGAAGYRLVGLELTVLPSVPMAYQLALIGDGQATAVGQMPARVVLDRVYLHGHATLNLQRCVLLNAVASAVVDSYLGECHIQNAEGHGISAWSTPGPLRVENNYIEAAGIGMLVGGADPRITNLVPSDITVRGNYFYKPPSWKGVWTVKNAFELKNAQRVLLEGNVFDGSWVDAQVGFLLLFQAISQDNTAAWTTVQDVTVRYNVFRHATSGVNIASRVAYAYGGRAALLPAQPSQRMLIADNVFDDVCAAGQGGCRLFQLLGDLQDVTVTHNSGDASYLTLYMEGAAQTRLVLTNNLLGHGAYGMFGDSRGEGTAAFATYAPGAVVAGNVLYGSHGGTAVASQYPSGNAFPASAAAAGLLDGALGTLGTIDNVVARASLVTTTSGRTPGPDLSAVTSATATTIRGY